MTNRTVRLRWTAPAAVLASTALLLAGCSGGSDASETSAAKDSINYALPVDFTPNWILPIGTSTTLNTNNGAIAESLWEPLVAYDGTSGSVGWDQDASLASDVEFADDGTSVTITLKDRTWSDGEAVTSRDVEFFYNLITANKDEWGHYSEGKAPDNWTSFTVVDDSTFTITFDQAYNPDWMLANQLSLIVPLPQHAWDKTSDDGEVSDLDETTEGAQAVWDYLLDAAGDIAGYEDETLWDTIDGPYALESFSTSGKVVLTANTAYDGDQPAQITTVNLLPFTSSDAEENALRAGEVDYGYISATNIDQSSTYEDLGYTVEPWSGWSITYMPLNFNNPEMGAVFSQLYARQAIQMSVDQDSLTSVVFNGTATAGYGPIPQAQDSDFISDEQSSNPYPYDTDAASALLEANGWTRNADGYMECTDAGTGDGQCGDGIAEGTVFEFTILSQSGSDVTDNEMVALQSSMATTGIKFNITTAPVSSVLSQTPACTADDDACSWQASFFGTAGSWYFSAYPTGDVLFKSGSAVNFGSYSSADADALIEASTTSTDSSVIQDYSALLADDLPVIWLPSPVYQVSVISSDLEAFTQDSLAAFHPSQWSWAS